MFNLLLQPCERFSINDRPNDIFPPETKRKGLVQMRLWVNKEDEEFFKYLAKQSRPQRELLKVLKALFCE